MTALNAGAQTGLARMAEIAIVDRPGYLAIVACTAKSAVGYLFHCHVVGTYLHLESEFRVTYPALETDAVKPVRKNDRADTFLFRSFI